MGSGNPGLTQRRQQYMLSEKCAEFTDETVALWGAVLRGDPIAHTEIREGKKVKVTEYPNLDDRLKAGDRLMDRAFGKPAVAVEVDQTTREMTKVVYEVRWMSPDPNDKSVVTVPEPD
jgi:hypothetical protein